MRNQGIEEIFVDVTQARIFIAQAKATVVWQEYIDNLSRKRVGTATYYLHHKQIQEELKRIDKALVKV